MMAFARFCARHGVAHVPTLSVWDRGHETERTNAPWPDRVVLKPVLSSNSVGLEFWERRGGHYQLGGHSCDAATLRLRGAALSKAWGRVIAQPWLSLAPALADRGVTGMPTMRMTTGRWPDGRVALIDAYLSAPLPGRIASNDGIGPYWSIDLATGTLGPSHSQMLPAWTGTPLEGLVLPGWDRAREQALLGHRQFPQPVLILGWDVAFTTDGPVMIEANTGIGFSFEQAIRQDPAGPGILGDLLEAWAGQVG